MTEDRTLIATVLAILTSLLAACGGGSDGGSSMPPPPPGTTLSVQRVFPNLSFTQPVAMLQVPGDAARWFVVEQTGFVRVFENTAAVGTTTVFVDIDARVNSTCSECGLLGMAFHPTFPADPRVYLSYTSGNLQSRISEFRTLDAGLTLDPGTERVLITVDQPETNHNGGGIAFGPDGFLYIGFGDGGGGNDQHGAIGNGQLLMTLLGKMLRIDIDIATAPFYRAPTDNPFAANPLCGTNGTGTQNCPEIFAWGFRNPWRWSFDRQSGQLWVGDVGQSALEEVSRVAIGGNYGWRCFEGTRNTGFACGSPANLQAPVAEYGRSVGTTVTGGYVYRGTASPALVGRYVFGDFGSGRIWHIAADAAPTLTMTSGFDSGLNISSFGEGNDGEIYVVHYVGTLHRVTGT
jgi:glucose/arabinose dehydrogenase